MDFQITFDLHYSNHSTSGKITNVRGAKDKADAKNRFFAHAWNKYKNAEDIIIINFKTILNKESVKQEDETVSKLKNMFNMN